MSLFQIDFAVSTNEDWHDAIALVSGADSVEEPYDLSDTSFLMHIRKSAEVLDVELELSTDNGRIVIGDPATDGKISFNVPRATVDDLDPGVYVHDIVWILADGREVNLAKGTVTISLGVTR